MLQDSSDEEVEVPTIHRAFDRMFATDGFPFIIGGQPGPLAQYHPSPIHIFQLWQIYIDNINPLLKITHVPTVQAQIIEASSNIEKAPKSIEALMFSIYLMAITSLEDDDVQRMFNEPKQELLGRYHTATQQAVTNAGFMRNNDPILLQAYLLYLVSSLDTSFCPLSKLTRFIVCSSLVCRPTTSLLPHWHCSSRRPTNGSSSGSGTVWTAPFRG